MTIIGNLFLAIAILIFLGLNTGSLSRSAPGGDAGVGYAWGIIILTLGFILMMTLITIIISVKGGFDWISVSRSARIGWVTAGLLSILFTFGMSMLMRHEGGPVPALLRVFTKFVPIAVPLVLIIAGFILLNQPLRNAVPVAIYKWPLILITVVGFAGTLSAIGSFVGQSAKNTSAAIKARAEGDDENTRRMLADIDSCDVTKNMVFILVYTGKNQDKEVYERSVAKVKTNPQWQQELVRLLQTDWATEPFQFLASNEVDDPAMFLEPVREGVLIQARLIRESIRNASHPSHYYEGQFSWEVERVLNTVDRFKGKGVDYKPAIQELRDAFNEPSEYEKPKWYAIKLIEQWLKKN